jgi:hypothetical protein
VIIEAGTVNTAMYDKGEGALQTKPYGIEDTWPKTCTTDTRQVAGDNTLNSAVAVSVRERRHSCENEKLAIGLSMSSGAARMPRWSTGTGQA